MDNISETRTEVESITAHHEANNVMTAPATSISQEPLFDASAQQQHDDNDNELNVSFMSLQSFSLIFIGNEIWRELFLNFQGYAERKVGFSFEEAESDKNNSEGEEMAKKLPIKLHRR